MQVRILPGVPINGLPAMLIILELGFPSESSEHGDKPPVRAVRCGRTHAGKKGGPCLGMLDESVKVYLQRHKVWMIWPRKSL